jgi:hypothetical protein
MDERQRHHAIHRYAKEISKKTRYPIKNFGQLLKALGGAEAPIEFEQWRAPAGRLKQFIPEHYFPVVSEEDLARKGEALLARYKAGGGEPQTDLPAQPEEEMPSELRAAFAEFRRRNVDLTKVRPVIDSEADGGVARLTEE